MVHAEVQVPPTQYGVIPWQSALVLQLEVGFGTHTPFELQVKPIGHGVEPEQLATHWPSSQTWSALHWLEYLHTVVDGSQAPLTHESPLGQSLLVEQGQGPAVPPQVMHSPL
jgi:hypothetical protein